MWWSTDQIELIDRAIARAAAGRPNLLWVEGDSGQGKSSLLGEIGARARGFHVVRLEGVEDLLGTSYALVEQWPLPVAVDPGAVPFQVAQDVRRLIDRVAHSAPVLILVDDFQWADAESSETLAWVLQRAEGDRLLIAAAGRPLRPPSHVGVAPDADPRRCHPRRARRAADHRGTSVGRGDRTGRRRRILGPAHRACRRESAPSASAARRARPGRAGRNGAAAGAGRADREHGPPAVRCAARCCSPGPRDSGPRHRLVVGGSRGGRRRHRGRHERRGDRRDDRFAGTPGARRDGAGSDRARGAAVRRAGGHVRRRAAPPASPCRRAWSRRPAPR